MSFLVLIPMLAAVAGAAGVAWAVRRQRQRQLELNTVVPGVLSAAPPSWAGSHTEEAKLHRRLRDTVAALRADPRVMNAGLMQVQLAVEHEATAVDERLVAVANLPAGRRQKSLTELTAAVETIEQAVADIVTWSPQTGVDLTTAVSRATERLALIAQAQAELTSPPPPPALPPSAPNPRSDA